MKLNPFVMMRKEFDGTGIVFDPENNKAMSLNATGVTIWESLEKGLAQDAVVAAVTEKFAIDAETAKQDVAAFLALLTQKGLLSEE